MNALELILIIPTGIGNVQLFAAKKYDFCVRKPRQSTHSVCVFCLETKFFLNTTKMVKPIPLGIVFTSNGMK